jgi:hypothetical protein
LERWPAKQHGGGARIQATVLRKLAPQGRRPGEMEWYGGPILGVARRLLRSHFVTLLIYRTFRERRWFLSESLLTE